MLCQAFKELLVILLFLIIAAVVLEGYIMYSEYREYRKNLDVNPRLLNLEINVDDLPRWPPRIQ